jgi:hypothetical protein
MTGKYYKPSFGMTEAAFDEMARSVGLYLRINHRGPENGTTHPELAPALGLEVGTSGRPGQPCSDLLTALIKRARQCGSPICTNGGRGKSIYYANTKEQALATANSMRATAESELEDAAFMANAAVNAGWVEGLPLPRRYTEEAA